MLGITVILGILARLTFQRHLSFANHIKILLKTKRKIQRTHGGTQPKPMNKKQASYKAIHWLRSLVHRKKKPIMIKVQTYNNWHNHIPVKHFSRRQA